MPFLENDFGTRCQVDRYGDFSLRMWQGKHLTHVLYSCVSCVIMNTFDIHVCEY